MKIKRICILGGTGFVGTHLVAKLADAGYQCKVLARHPHRHRNLGLLSGCQVVQLNGITAAELTRQFSDCDAAINLVGILNESRDCAFEYAHVTIAQQVIEACIQSKTPRLLHMSALNASESSTSSKYLHTKGKGENHMHNRNAGVVQVTSFRPSVIFGHDDSFINRFAQLVQIPGTLPLACAQSQFAPVYIADVCQAFVNALDNQDTFGKRYELCGPRVMTLREIVDYLAWHLGKHKSVLELGPRLSKLQARLLGIMPGKLFTLDNYHSLQLASVCQENGLQELGITPTDMDAIVPYFLNN